MSQASQRVSKLSRRAGRSARQPPTSAPEPPDLDTSDDFTPSLSFARSRTRSTLSQSSCAAEPSSSQSQRLSGEITAAAVSFCGVLDTVAQRAAGELFPTASDVRKTDSDVRGTDSDVRGTDSDVKPTPSDVKPPGGQKPGDSGRGTSAATSRGGRTRRTTRASTRSTRSARSSRQSSVTASEGSPPPDAPEPAKPPTIDLSRFARGAPDPPPVPPPSVSDPGHSLTSESGAAGAASSSPAPPPSVSDIPSVSTAQASAVGVSTTSAAAPPTVADCPVCLQPQPSAAARTAHLKLCGERRGLTPAQLLAAVRLQQRQAGERAAAGLPATRAAPPPAARRTRTGQQGRRRGAVASSADGDAELQMALAVSASLRDEQERSRRLAEAQLLELGLEGELEAVRDSGGAVPPEPPAPAPASDDPPAGRSRGRGGRKKGPAATSVLVTQTKEERDRRLCEKVAELLAWEEVIPVEPRRLRARKGSPQPAVAWQKAAQLHDSEGDYYVPELAGLVEPCTAPVTSLLRDVADIPGRESLTQKAPEEHPDDDNGAEDMDTTAAGDALGATQAALLLLAGDAEDSESSQPPADSAEPPTSPGDSGDSGDLGVTAESAGVIPEGETVPKDEEGSGVDKDADSNDVAKMDVVMEDPAKTEGEKGKEQCQEGDDVTAEVSETAEQSQDKKTALLVGGEIETVRDGITEVSLKPEEPVPVSPNASPGAGCDLKTDLTTDGDYPQKSPVPTATSVGADKAHRPSPVIRRRARLSGQLGGRSKGSGSASLTTERTGKQSDSDTNHTEKTSAAVTSSTAGTITSSSGSITTPASTATTATPRCGGATKEADPSPGSSPRPIPPTPESGSPAPSSDGGCFLAPAGDLGAALLELLLTGRGPPAETLLCRDGSVPVHAAVMAVRCPPLYRELSEAGGRLSLPVSHRAAAALVRLLYLGEIVFTSGGTPLPQLLLLAERFELLELAYYLRREHGVTMPEPVKEAELVKVTGSQFRPSSPAPAETSIDRPPLSPELFDLTASDGGEDMEEGSPVHATASESDREHSPHRDSDSDVVCSPNQSPRRVGANTGLQSPYKRTPGAARSGGTPRRRERTLSDRDKTPVRDTGNPSPSRRLSGRDSNPATPSTPRRGQKRPVSPSRRPVSPDDICEVFSSLSKRRRTSSPATPSPVKARLASPSTRRHQGESRFSRTPVGRRSSSNTPQKVGSGSQEPPRRPVSADSDIEILDEAPMVFTQKVRSPRRCSVLEGDGSPVKEASLESGDQGGQGGVSQSKAQTEASQAQSPVGGVSPQSSPSRSQPRKQTELQDDSFGSSPLISRRQEPAADSQSPPSPPPTAERRESEANGADSPATPRRLPAESDRPDTGGAASPVVMPPCSPEIPAPSSGRSPGRTSPGPPSPEVRQKSEVSPPRPPSDREGSPEPAPSPPSDPPPADVWDGFEDCGYIELIEPPPPPLGTPLRPSTAAPAAADAAPVAAAAAEAPAGPRTSLDNSELWGDSSLLAGYTTPTEAETTTTSRRADSGTLPVHQENAGDSRVQSTGSDTPLRRPKGAGTPLERPVDSETSEQRQGQAGARSGGTDDAGTPETTMAPPRPPQRTPVNPYRVVLRDSNTPRPNYVLMLTPELKRELARIGVKPISRRKAVALLSHIYEETHPPATGASGGGQSSRPVTATAGSRGTSAATSSSAGPTSSKAARAKTAAAPSVSSTSRPCPASPSDGPESGGDGEFVRPREPSPTRDGGRSDSDSDSESSGSEGAAARLEETLSRLGERLELEEEEEITPSQAASATALPERLRSYILSRPELYHQVLTYEPVWLESLHRDLRQHGIKLSMAQLMDFLDEQCITFRTENSGRRRKSPKKKKSPKKGSPKKRGPSQKKRSPKKKAS